MSVIEVFDKGGYPLGEFVADASREWVLNGYGGRNVYARCEFEVGLIDPKVKTGWFEYGNHILIRDRRLPWWSGPIETSRRWDAGNTLQVTAYSAEYLLYRRRGFDGLGVTGTPGDYFERVLELANQQGDTLIQPGSIAKRGTPQHRHYDFSHFSDGVNEFAAEFKQDWFIEPEIVGGRLVYWGHWLEKRGRLVDFILDEFNTQLRGVNEEGEIVNDLEGVNSAGSEDSRLRCVARDPASIGRFGLHQARENFDAETKDELQTLVEERLKQTAYPARRFDVSALPPDSERLTAACAWPYLSPGNVLTLQYQRAGLDNGTLGILTQARLTSMTHREEQDNMTDLVFEEER